MNWWIGEVGFVVGAAFTEALNVIGSLWIERRKKEQALAAAREAELRAEKRGKREKAWPLFFLRECRKEVRRETGITWGAMDEGADPPESPRPTLPPSEGPTTAP